MTKAKARRRVKARYIGPGANFPHQGAKATGDTVDVFADEIAGRWDLEATKKSKPTTPAE